jgi:phosphomevalonate kinase
MKLIIGVSGKLGSGKNYIVSNLIIPVLKELNKNYLEISFADQIKVNVMTKKGIRFNDIYVKKTSETRRLLQIEGTEEGRNSSLGADIWVKYLDNWITVFNNRNIDVFIVPDCRFKNELDYIKKHCGIVVKVVAPVRNQTRLEEESKGDHQIMEKLRTHRSECDLDEIKDTEYDLVITNDPNDKAMESNTYVTHIKNIIQMHLTQ